MVVNNEHTAMAVVPVLPVWVPHAPPRSASGHGCPACPNGATIRQRAGTECHICARPAFRFRYRGPPTPACTSFEREHLGGGGVGERREGGGLREDGLVGVLYLLRHGQASFGTDDYDRLSEIGVRQAEVLGDELRRRGARLDLVVSGSLRRQRETASAALTAAALDLPVEVDSRWNEYDHTGIIERYADTPELTVTPATRAAVTTAGSSPRVFQALLDVGLAGWMSADRASGPGSWSAFQSAVSDALDGVIDRLGPGRCAAVFTSAGPIMAVCARLLEIDANGRVALNRVMANAGITKIVTGRSGTSLVSLNEHGHLEAAGREYLTYR